MHQSHRMKGYNEPSFSPSGPSPLICIAGPETGLILTLGIVSIRDCIGTYNKKIESPQVQRLRLTNTLLQSKRCWPMIDAMIFRYNARYCSWLVDSKVGRPLELVYYSARNQSLDLISENKRLLRMRWYHEENTRSRIHHD